MNNRLIHSLLFVTSSLFLLASCSESNDSFKTPSATNTSQSGTVSQKNFSVLPEDTQPEIYDENGVATDKTLVITVKVGDSNNQLLTDPHTVFFSTEWGLIEPSCVTENGICTVNWQTSFGPGTVPADHLVTITAYTLGEEDYSDTNGNGVFDDGDQPFPASGDLFTDRSEPYVDADLSLFFGGTFNGGDSIIDVINGNVPGKNSAHDNGDGFLNSPTCKHSSLCSTVSPTTYIWDDTVINMDGPP